MASLEQEEIDKLLEQQQRIQLAESAKEKLSNLYKELVGYSWKDQWSLSDIIELCNSILNKLDIADSRYADVELLRNLAEDRLLMR